MRRGLAPGSPERVLGLLILAPAAEHVHFVSGNRKWARRNVLLDRVLEGERPEHASRVAAEGCPQAIAALLAHGHRPCWEGAGC